MKLLFIFMFLAFLDINFMQSSFDKKNRRPFTRFI